jgi:hypothetical protein
MGHRRGHREAGASTRHQLGVEGIDAPVEVRRHPTAQRMTLRVSRTQRAVILTMPIACDLAAADKFISLHIEWVRERLGSMPGPIPFGDGTSIPLRGIAHRLVFAGSRPQARPVEIGSAAGEPLLVVSGWTEHAPRRLLDWLVDEARRDLEARVAFHTGRLGLKARTVTVRDQTSRWGSCSTTGALSFSWRLVMAPPLVLDYVAAHEVAHLAEMNHGPRFWTLVRWTFPEMDEAKRWLHVYGMDLHRYGARTS